MPASPRSKILAQWEKQCLDPSVTSCREWLEMPDSAATASLTAFAGTFNRTSRDPDFQKSEAERLLITERYPLSQLADLTLEAYATGEGEDYSKTLSGL